MNSYIYLTIVSSWLYYHTTCVVAFLQHNQWKQINALIIRPNLSPEIRNTLNKVIYKHYSAWALYQTIQFKKFHYYKCKHIPLEELHLYTLEGLQKGIQHYDASSSFFNYIQYYIRGRLYKGMSDLQPLSNVSLRKRMRKQNKNNQKNTNITNHQKNEKKNKKEKEKQKEKEKEKEKKNKKQNTLFVGENIWIFDEKNVHLRDHNEDYGAIDSSYEKKVKIWDFINNHLSLQDRKIMIYKYDFDFNELRSNKKIAELMVFSEEKIRVQLHEIKHKINNVINTC